MRSAEYVQGEMVDVDEILIILYFVFPSSNSVDIYIVKDVASPNY